MFEINTDDLQKGIDQMNEFGSRVEKVIKPFLSEDKNEKRTIEVCHVGKFLALLDENATIVTHGDRPDFVIADEGFNIGLEHQRILKSDKVELMQSVSKLFDDAAKLFKLEHPSHKLLVNCWLTTENFEFSKSDSEKLKKQISDYIYNFITDNSSSSKPDFIEEILVMDHSDVAFEYNPGGYITRDIDSETLQQAINKKESLFEKYRENSKLERQWLLLVVGGVSPDSFRFRIDSINPPQTSNFERIYLLEDFDAKIWRLL